MGRSTDAVRDLTTTVSVQRLAESAGVALKRKGSVLIGACPFHASKAPTLTITPKQNTWSCTGKCRVKSGTVIEWVMKAEGVSRRHALELLKQGYTPGSGATAWKKSTVKKLDTFEAELPDYVLLAKVVEFYSEQLRQSPEAQRWLREHRLDRPELIERFKIGFADRSLGYRLPERNRKAGKAIREQLIRLGVLRSTGHEHFRGCVTIPITDADGAVVNVYGHRIGKSVRGEPMDLWLRPESDKGVFNATGILAPDVVLTDHVLDALAVVNAGFTSCTVAHDAVVEPMKTKGVERVLIAFPRTEAGNTKADKLAHELVGQGFTVHRVVFPHGLGAHEFVKAAQDAGSSRSLSTLIQNAAWIAGVRDVQSVGDATPSEQARPAHEHEVVLQHGNRRWRIRGLERNTTLDKLTVNIFVAVMHGEEQGAFHADTLDLYQARARLAFIKMTAAELGIDEPTIKADIGKVLLELERRLHAALEADAAQAKPYEMSEAEREQAMKLLRGPQLIERILDDLGRFTVGENTNKFTAYLAATSRKLEDPLAILVQSSSSAGKSSLVDAVLSLVPEEERLSYSAVTGQALFYAGATELRHKVLSVSEHEGAREAGYALKLLQSERGLRIASTGKDAITGRMQSHTYEVQGPVAIFLTTAASDVDEELGNRCITLHVDEGEEQTRAIHEAQRQARTLEGLQQRHELGRLRSLHQNMQRLLASLAVVNPFATELNFTASNTRARRDHRKYLGLIDALALLHQHQRPRRKVQLGTGFVEYIEVTKADIETADMIAKEVFGGDELPPQTRVLLKHAEAMAKSDADKQGVDIAHVRFTRRQLREHIGWSETQTRLHVERLVRAEYLFRERKGNAMLYGLASISTGTMPISRGEQGISRGVRGVPPREASSSDDADLPRSRGFRGGTPTGSNGKSASYPQVTKARR